MAANDARARNGLPFNFKDGLKIKDVSLETPAVDALIGMQDDTAGSKWTTLRGFFNYLKSAAGSALIGYQPTTGLATTVQSKLRDIDTALQAVGQVQVGGQTVDLSSVLAGFANAGVNTDITELNGLTTPLSSYALKGNNVDITSLSAISSINGGPLSGMRNKIINGDMVVWQYGSAGTGAPAGTFTADRFFLTGVAQLFNWSQQSVGTLGTLPETFTTCLNFGAQAAAGDYYVVQRIENVKTVSPGKSITFSFWAKCNTGTVTLTAIGLKQYFGSGGSAAVDVRATGMPTLTTTWQKITKTIVLPTTVGKTVGVNNYVEAYFGIPATTQGIYTTGWQVEEGTVASSFEHRLLSMEEMLCKRYYVVGQIYAPLAQYNGMASFILESIDLPVMMRVAPAAWSYATTIPRYWTTWANQQMSENRINVFLPFAVTQWQLKYQCGYYPSGNTPVPAGCYTYEGFYEYRASAEF